MHHKWRDGWRDSPPKGEQARQRRVESVLAVSMSVDCQLLFVTSALNSSHFLYLFCITIYKYILWHSQRRVK